MNHKHATKGIISIAILTLSLLSLMLLTPFANAALTTPSPTPPSVGGETVPVDILQLLAPYLIIAALGVAAIVAIVLYKKKAT